MKTTLIIRARASGGFWTGRSWSDEYPDAELYSSAKKASASAMRAVRGTQDGVEVIADYGLDSQRIVLGVQE